MRFWKKVNLIQNCFNANQMLRVVEMNQKTLSQNISFVEFVISIFVMFNFICHVCYILPVLSYIFCHVIVCQSSFVFCCRHFVIMFSFICCVCHVLSVLSCTICHVMSLSAKVPLFVVVDILSSCSTLFAVFVMFFQFCHVNVCQVSHHLFLDFPDFDNRWGGQLSLVGVWDQSMVQTVGM